MKKFFAYTVIIIAIMAIAALASSGGMGLAIVVGGLVGAVAGSGSKNIRYGTDSGVNTDWNTNQPGTDTLWDDSPSNGASDINPATGLSMIGGGFDAGGNAFGTTSNSDPMGML